MQDIAGHIASRLKALRQARGWSLDRTARATGVSKAMLGQIERGESSPTVATLWKIASGFVVSFSSLFAAPGEVEAVGEARWGHDAAGMQARLLFPFDPLLGFEMFEIEMAPGAVSASAPHAAGVVEHIVVVEGTLGLSVDGDQRRLAAGEGLRFHADRHHEMENLGDGVMRFHDVIHYLPGAASGE
ncbi:transcriptional regulator, XRE family with cupin sensor [Franzmannia pantelleriensis]|uniref:Transcriptional regulator, XRE family with cupin sensor n=1 Tax=Franzmannia pantelleriensis TaxID=48727 RepID=A0A1G9UGW8_9GAMM|nr:XRE family transcriptional regulator [Halomonas pantelleriensis]SDM59063.1 transcriptional regulator, XRE family with cupin sensor [Halomonas pantelleriensis]